MSILTYEVKTMQTLYSILVFVSVILLVAQFAFEHYYCNTTEPPGEEFTEEEIQSADLYALMIFVRGVALVGWLILGLINIFKGF